MASIRPLVTITILAVVGAYLYVKINEGPAPSRAATNALSQPPSGVPPLTGTKGTSLAADSSAPAWPPTTAPAAPQPIAPAPAVPVANPSTADAAKSKANVPAVPAIPELPPLPSLNDTATTATQLAPPLPKDIPASVPATRYPDQPVQTLNAATGKETPGQSPPLTASDPVKPGPSAGAPQSPIAAPTAPPSTTPTLNPAANAASPPAGVGIAATTPPPESPAQNPLRPVSPASDDRYGTASTTTAPPAASTTSTTPTTPTTPVGAPAAASFAASWPEIQAALDRRDLKKAHQLLSKWHADESLSPTDTAKVESLLSQLAGTVIYSTEHQLEPARVVKAGETLETISKEYNVPSQLLAKINGISSPNQVQPGQQLKVVRGPFVATVDLRRNELTLSVDDRYAGKFRVTVPQGTMLTDGQWLVDQKLAGPTTTANASAYATTPIPADRTIILRNAAATAAGAPTLMIASGSGNCQASNPPALRVSPQDAEELSDILSVGSRVVVRK